MNSSVTEMKTRSAQLKRHAVGAKKKKKIEVNIKCKWPLKHKLSESELVCWKSSSFAYVYITVQLQCNR